MIIEPIPKQNFELIRDQIGVILKQEIANQESLSGQTFESDIYSERTTAVQNDELITLNINLESYNQSSKNQNDSMNGLNYNIDFYSVGFESETEKGWENSSFRIHKYIGWVRYILSHTTYKTLGFKPGFISGTSVESFFIMEPDLRQDSSFVRMARLVFNVRSSERQSMESGPIFESNETKVKLFETDLGFQYKFIN